MAVLEFFNFFDLFVNQLFGGGIFFATLGFALVLAIIGIVTKQSPPLYLNVIIMFFFSMLLVLASPIAAILFIMAFMYFGYNLMALFIRREDGL